MEIIEKYFDVANRLRATVKVTEDRWVTVKFIDSANDLEILDEAKKVWETELLEEQRIQENSEKLIEPDGTTN